MSRVFVLYLIFTAGVVLAQGRTETEPEETVKEDQETIKKYSGSKVFNVEKEKGKEIFNQFIDKGDAEFWGVNETHLDVFVPKEKLDTIRSALEEKKIDFHIKIDDVQKAIDDENPKLEDLEEFEGRKGHKMTFRMYHRLTDIYGYLDYLAETYPDYVTVGTIGKSVEGRDIRFIKISSGAPNAKKFWIDGGIHAREWITPATTTYIISELVENRSQHKRETEGIDYYIVPVLNPDGYEYTHTRERLWRKNRSKGHYYCLGTDLNRNWGYHWGGKGTSAENCQEIFKGRGPFSEPETRAASNFILNNSNNMKAFITFHSYGQYILIPFGYDQNQRPSDFNELLSGAQSMAEAIRSVGGAHYSSGNSASLLYPASGGADDWAKGGANIKYTYTIELRDKGTYGFILPSSQIMVTAKEGLAAVKALSLIVQQTP